ncbi:hypothetical protein FB2170_02585 [Maribacter sp. HTCC2170]|nr:hypothetical protein FB2170_02585 [Maribacter sp. HTCC2170]
MFVGFSQDNLNEYKYIIVPKKFDAFKRINQYKSSTLVKFLFSQEGFNAVYDDALPEDLGNNRCLGLTVGINDESSLFTTKMSISLKDCSSNHILTTITGSSKEKDYEDAYKEALTEAFETIRVLDYKYVPSNKEKVVANPDNNQEAKNRVKEKVVEQVATPERQVYKNNEPVASTIEKAVPVSETTVVEEKKNENILYAQEINDGYQLVDSTPKIRLKILRTSVKDVYTVKHEQDNGLVYKKDGKWYLEYYSNDKLNIEELNIKF